MWRTKDTASGLRRARSTLQSPLLRASCPSPQSGIYLSSPGFTLDPNTQEAMDVVTPVTFLVLRRDSPLSHMHHPLWLLEFQTIQRVIPALQFFRVSLNGTTTHLSLSNPAVVPEVLITEKSIQRTVCGDTIGFHVFLLLSLSRSTLYNLQGGLSGPTLHSHHTKITFSGYYSTSVVFPSKPLLISQLTCELIFYMTPTGVLSILAFNHCQVSICTRPSDPALYMLTTGKRSNYVLTFIRISNTRDLGIMFLASSLTTEKNQLGQ